MESFAFGAGSTVYPPTFRSKAKLSRMTGYLLASPLSENQCTHRGDQFLVKDLGVQNDPDQASHTDSNHL